MKFAVALVLTALSPFALAQAPSKIQRPSSKEPAPGITWEKFLAYSEDWASYSAKIVGGSQVSITFRMTTSWIPGADHQGLLRYKLTAAPDIYATLKAPSQYPEVASPAKVETFVKRLGQYRMQIVFSDKDGFVDRKIPVNFIFGVDDDGHITSLMANDGAQMSMEEYKQLLTQGGWVISWFGSSVAQP
jgi:hypothetical protein